MYDFEKYQGAAGERNKISNLEACGDVIIQLSEAICFNNHKQFFDNLFCSFQLLEDLRKKKIWATRTLRKNRWQELKQF